MRTLLYELAYEKILSESLSSKEIVEMLNELKRSIKTAFYVPNIDGFIRSGRNKTNSHLKESALSVTSYIAKIASFKFRVDFHECGDLYFKKAFRSTEVKGMEKMVMGLVNDSTIETYDPRLVVVGNLCKNKVDMDKVKEYLYSFGYFNEILERKIGVLQLYMAAMTYVVSL